MERRCKDFSNCRPQFEEELIGNCLANLGK